MTTARLFPLALAAVAVLGPATAAEAATKKTPALPKVSSIAPRQLKIGQKLTIKGSGFRAGKGKTTVVFQAGRQSAVFVKADTATTRTLTVTVPDRLIPQLTLKDGAAVATQFKLRIITTRFGRSWTSGKLAPIISPSLGAADAPGAATGSTPAPVAQPSPYQLCQAAAAAAPAGDADGDGLANGIESAVHTDPCNPDSDGDGLVDGYEYYSALDLNGNAVPYPGKRPWPNPLDPTDVGFDFDGDGLTLSQEYALWKYTGAHFPLTAYSDGTQNSGGSVPVLTTAQADLDLDHDGNLTDDERDADGDGLSNQVEMNYRGRISWWTAAYQSEKPYILSRFYELDATDPDTDGDGIVDGADDQDHDGWSNFQEMQVGREGGYRVQPYNPCLPDPHSLTCSRWAPFDNAPPPFDGSQVPWTALAGSGDLIPFRWPNQSTTTQSAAWDGLTGPVGP